MANLQEAINYMIANGYMSCVKGEYKLTTSFRTAMKALQAGGKVTKGIQGKVIPEIVAAITPVQVPALSPKLMVALSPEDWVDKYKQFILDAKIPARCEDRWGNLYDINKYSEPGMKAFRKAMESGVKYELLVMAVALYYKSGVKLKVAIGRYMEEGRWRTDYDALLSSAQDNKVAEHIKSVTDNGQYSSTKLG